jgi:hypothetical protein
MHVIEGFIDLDEDSSGREETSAEVIEKPFAPGGFQERFAPSCAEDDGN